MAGSRSIYLARSQSDEALGRVPWARPSTVYIALFTARGSDAQSAANTNFVEVNGGGYARQPVANELTAWSAASSAYPTVKANLGVVTFPTAMAPWGTVTAFGIYDAPTSGNLLYWADLTSP